MDCPDVVVEFVFDRFGAVELAVAYQILVPLRGRPVRPGQRGDGRDASSAVCPGVLTPAKNSTRMANPGRSDV